MILYSAWLRLPVSTRHGIANIFKIAKTGATEVVSNDVVRDGYSIQDIESAITVESLQSFLGSTQTNFQYLWEDMVDKVEGRDAQVRETFTAATEEEPVMTAEEIASIPGMASPLEPVTSEVLPEPIQEPKKNKGGRPKKNRT